MLKHPNQRKGSAKKQANQISEEKISEDHLSLNSLYNDSQIMVESFEHKGNCYYLYARSSSVDGMCPYCGSISHKVHSHYVRRITDLPILGKGVIICFETRKFFCSNTDCAHKTFAEQPGTEIFRYRRRTRRCEVFAAQEAGVCSSNSAARILRTMGINLCGGTILRDLHRIEIPDNKDVIRIGVDDWAYRKGISYGSILIDLDKGSFLGLLGSRSRMDFGKWLKDHLKVTIVSRDRSTDYSAAIAESGRGIMEVADRFHLMMNLSTVVDKTINENYEEYRNLVRAKFEVQKRGSNKKKENTLLLSSGLPDKRQAAFDTTKHMQQLGMTRKEIEKVTGLSHSTIVKYKKMDTLPPRAHSTRNKYGLYEERVKREYLIEGKSLNAIRKELVAEGENFSSTPFYEYFRYLSKDSFRQQDIDSDLLIENNSIPLLSPKNLALILDKSIRGKFLDEIERNQIEVMSRLPWFIELSTAAESFVSAIKESSLKKLMEWIEKYRKSSLHRIKTFVHGLTMDLDAVKNTVRYPISNGIVEGHVNKLKAIKRVMYGRAGLSLLCVKMYLAENVFFN